MSSSIRSPIHSVGAVSRSSVKLAKWCGYALAPFAIADVGDHRYDPEEIPLGLTDLGAWAWMDQRGQSDILLVAPMLGALAYDSLSGISGVTISNGVVSVKHGIQAMQFALADITAVRLALRPI